MSIRRNSLTKTIDSAMDMDERDLRAQKQTDTSDQWHLLKLSLDFVILLLLLQTMINGKTCNVHNAKARALKICDEIWRYTSKKDDSMVKYVDVIE